MTDPATSDRNGVVCGELRRMAVPPLQPADAAPGDRDPPAGVAVLDARGMFTGPWRPIFRCAVRVRNLPGRLPGVGARDFREGEFRQVRDDHGACLPDDRWGIFEGDARGQLAAAGTPLTDVETRRLGQLEGVPAEARPTLEVETEEIRWSPGSTPPLRPGRLGSLRWASERPWSS